MSTECKSLLETTLSLFLQVCVTAAGRNDRSAQDFAAVDWMAYQGAPDGGVAGKTRLPEWWTGSQCKEVTLPQASVHFYTLGSFLDTRTTMA